MKNMTAMNAKRKQAGFTIIELVVVILLLGILTATALPRFMDVTDEAHAAVVDALEGGLATGTALFRAQWVAESQPRTSAVSEFNLFASTISTAGKTPGYPRGDAATIDADVCKEVYDNVLQPGGRPIAASFTSADPDALALETDVETASALPANSTATVLANLLQAADILDSTTCNYYYIGQFRKGTLAAPATVPIISYDFTTGTITRSSISLATGT